MSKIAKPWKLTEQETFSSYTAWQHNMLYTLKQEKTFTPFLTENVQWGKLTAANPHRGFTDDVGADGKTKEDKTSDLNAMLRYISQWAPHYLANDIEKHSTSLDSVWQFIRKYYSFQQSEVQFMKLSAIKLEENERPERLYQRILAHLQDNLLIKDSKLKHDGQKVTQNEDISPTVERLAVLRWMEVIDPDLPNHVARAFAHDLQTMTLKDLQPQIVDAMDSLLEEISSKRVTCSASRTLSYASQGRSRPPSRFENRLFSRGAPKSQRRFPPSQTSRRGICRICQAEGRPHYHSLAMCDYMSRAEKREMVQSFRVDADYQETFASNVDSDLSENLDTLELDEQE